MSDRGRNAPIVLIATAPAKKRRRWRQALRKAFTVHEVSQRDMLERSLGTLRPDVLLLDLALPQIGGVNGIALIKRLSPSTKIVLFSRNLQRKEGISVLKAGAWGYCAAGISPPLLQTALQAVARGEIWVGRKLIPYLLMELTALTARRSVAKLVSGIPGRSPLKQRAHLPEMKKAG